MDNQLQIFENKEFGEIRMIEVNGKPYAVGVDIARALEYSNPSKAVIQHCKGITKLGIPSGGGVQETNVIPEGDIYRLIIKAADQSKNPNIKAKAEKFESWIFDEVLPTIRKHGAYMTEEIIEKTLTDPDFIIKLATQLKEERQKRLEAERLTNQIAVSENSLLVREVAKIASKRGIIIGEKRLWNKLREWGLIFKNSTEPKQEYIDRGYFEVVEGVTETYKGTFTYRTTKVTGKGQVYIIKRLLEEKMQEEIADVSGVK